MFCIYCCLLIIIRNVIFYIYFFRNFFTWFPVKFTVLFGVLGAEGSGLAWTLMTMKMMMGKQIMIVMTMMMVMMTIIMTIMTIGEWQLWWRWLHWRRWQFWWYHGDDDNYDENYWWWGQLWQKWQWWLAWGLEGEGPERPPGAQIVQPPSSRAEKRMSINIYVVKFSIVCGEWPQDLCQLCFMAWLDTCREKKMFTLKIVVVKVMVLQDVLWIRWDHCIAWLPLLADWGCSKCKLPKLLSLSFNVINQNQNQKH